MGLMIGLYLTGEIGFTVKEKQQAYGKGTKRVKNKGNQL